jgi:hypothetical protein
VRSLPRAGFAGRLLSAATREKGTTGEGWLVRVSVAALIALKRSDAGGEQNVFGGFSFSLKSIHLVAHGDLPVNLL